MIFLLVLLFVKIRKRILEIVFKFERNKVQLVYLSTHRAVVTGFNTTVFQSLHKISNCSLLFLSELVCAPAPNTYV